MSRKQWRYAAVVVSALTSAGVFLHTAPVQAAEEAKGPNTGKVSVSAGVEFPTAYFFRGILQEDQDFIAEPFADVTFKLYEGSGAINSMSATVGIWNSFHSGPTGGSGTNGDPRSWYEADLYGGVTFGLFENWEVGATYTAYTSPNGAFKTVQEIAFRVSYDDSKLLGDFALSPHATVAIEAQGAADGTNSGVYLELGVEPGLTLIKSDKYPVSLAIPITVGLSIDDYYEFGTGNDDTFGYFDTGLVASVPLAFIPADFGAWEFHAGVHFFFLGDNLETVNNGDSFQAVGTFGISMAY